MKSFLTITTPASDLTLLTIAEMRAAAGGITTADAALTAMETRCAARITTYCNVAVGVGAEPTLRSEVLTETFRLVRASELMLARRHNVTIASIVVDGTTLAADEYETDPESALIRRLSDDVPIRWYGNKVVVVYTAGFATVPADLRQAAIDFLNATYRESGRDPLVKSERENIPGIMEKEKAYWVGSIPGQSYEGTVPDPIAGQLTRFLNPKIG